LNLKPGRKTGLFYFWRRHEQTSEDAHMITNARRSPYLAIAALLLALGSASDAASPPSGSAPMNHQLAEGQFDVKLAALPAYNDAEAARFGRRSIDKQFHGDLDAVSRGEMLSAGTAVPGSAGYVAIEYVTGSLHGRTGSFALQHTGTLDRGQPTLSVTVVPDSGTGELSGLRGSMDIIITGSEHRYRFDYTLPAAP